MNPALRHLYALRAKLKDRLNAAALDLRQARLADDDFEAALIETECDTWLRALAILEEELAKAEREARDVP